MKNKHFLCCINDCPLFCYHPIVTDDPIIVEQVIVNFVTGKTINDKWITRETTFESNVEFFYYEVNVEKAFQLMRKKKKSTSSIENFCFTFLNYFLQDSAEPLIEFLRSTNSFTNKELNEFRKLFA